MSTNIEMTTNDAFPFVLVKKPGEPFKKVLFPDPKSGKQLEWLQEQVGGYIETVQVEPLNAKLLLICNEEGKLLGLEPNICMNGDLIAGTVVIVSYKGEDMVHLTKEQYEAFKTNFTEKGIAQWFPPDC